MRAAVFFASLIMVLSSFASAKITEMEPNNSIATATPIGSILDDTTGGVFSLTPGDVDYFVVDLEPGYFMSAVVTPMSTNYQVPDTFMGLLDAQGNVLKYDEDSDADSNDPSGYGSMIQYEVTTAGKYYIAVTGFTSTVLEEKDMNFDGRNDLTGEIHQQSGTYSLIAGAFLVPEPATISLLVLAVGYLYRKR